MVNMRKVLRLFTLLCFSIFSLAFMPIITTNEIYAADAFANLKINNEGDLEGVEKTDTTSGFNAIFNKYRSVIAGVSGIVAISMMLFFIIQAFRLGSSAHNASERQKAIQGLIWIGIATAITGSISLFAGLFYNMFQ